jgi:hypothetical protein
MAPKNGVRQGFSDLGSVETNGVVTMFHAGEPPH